MTAVGLANFLIVSWSLLYLFGSAFFGYEILRYYPALFIVFILINVSNAAGKFVGAFSIIAGFTGIVLGVIQLTKYDLSFVDNYDALPIGLEAASITFFVFIFLMSLKSSRRRKTLPE